MPPAPMPRYNPDGMLQASWMIVVQYDPTHDVLALSWTKAGDRWKRANRGAIAYPVDEVSDLLEGVAAQVSVLHTRRLF